MERFNKERSLSRISGRTRYPLITIVSFLMSVILLSSCETTPDPNSISNPEVHFKLGIAYLKRKDLNRAYIEFQEAIRLDPLHKESLNYLGYVSHLFKKYDESISYYKRAIAVSPDYSDAINNLGVVYVDTGEIDKAIDSFQKALANPLYRTPEQAFSNLGYAYYRSGDYESAEKALNNALLRRPSFPRAMYILGLVHVKRDNDHLARKTFIRAIGIDPDYFDAHWELAELYMREGSRAKALKHFRIIEERGDSYERKKEATERINSLKY